MATVINLHRKLYKDTEAAADTATKAMTDDSKKAVKTALLDLIKPKSTDDLGIEQPGTELGNALSSVAKAYGQVQSILKASQDKPPQDQEALDKLKETVKSVGERCLRDLKALHTQQLAEFDDALERFQGGPSAEAIDAVKQLTAAQNKQIQNIQSEIAEFEKISVDTLQQQRDSKLSAFLITQACKTLEKPEEQEEIPADEGIPGMVFRVGKKGAWGLLNTVREKIGLRDPSDPDVIQRTGFAEMGKSVAIGIPSWLTGVLANYTPLERVTGEKSEERLRDTITELFYGEKEDAETYGGVERQIARSLAFENVSEEVSKEGEGKGMLLSYKPRAVGAEGKETMGVDSPDAALDAALTEEEKEKMAGLWYKPHEGFLKGVDKYEFNDVLSAGAFTPGPGIFLLFASILAPNYGKFTITFDYVAAESKDSPIESGFALMADCATGLFSGSQNEVRAALLVHTARARGWKSIELRRMPKHLKDIAYLAARRAGFPHDAITYHGQKYSDTLRKKGDTQRGVVTGAWDTKQSSEVLTKLALNTQSLDPNLAPHRFFALDQEERLKRFKHKDTSFEQRAAILADGASNDIQTQAYINKVSDAEGLHALSNFETFALVNQLSSLDMGRALEVLRLLRARPDDQVEVFKLLAQGCQGTEPTPTGTAILAAELIAADAVQGRKLFNALELPKAQALVLQQAMLLPGAAVKIPTLFNELKKEKTDQAKKKVDQEKLVLEALGEITTEDNAKQTADLLLAVHNQEFVAAKIRPDEDYEGKPEAVEAIQDNTLNRFAKLANTIKDKAVLEAVRSEFINNLDETTKRRWAFMVYLDNRLNPLEHFNYQAFLAAMEPVNAKQWLMEKYNYATEKQFQDALKSNTAFIGEGISAHRMKELEAGKRLKIEVEDKASTESDQELISLSSSLSDSESESELESKIKQDPISTAGSYLLLRNEDCAKALADLLVADGDEAFLFEVLKALGPRKVAAIAGLKAADPIFIAQVKGKPSVFEKLVNAYKTQPINDETDAFLANLFTLNPAPLGKVIDDMLKLGSDDALLMRMIQHINKPDMLKGMLQTLEAKHLVEIIKAMPNATQKEKIFLHIKDDKTKGEVFRLLDIAQQNMVFRSLSPNVQTEFLENLATSKKPENLNRVLRLVSASEFTGKEDTFDTLKDTTKELLLTNATKPPAPFLEARLKNADEKNFERIMDMDRFRGQPPVFAEHYLAAVVATLLVLPKDMCAKLFMHPCLDQKNSDSPGTTVRYGVLLGLIGSKKSLEATSLVNQLKGQNDQTAFDALKERIQTDTAGGKLGADGDALRTLVGLPKLPAPKPQLGQQRTQ